jgi:hypothetical protein
MPVSPYRRVIPFCIASALFPLLTNAGSTPGAVHDQDGDGMDDAWELAHGLSPSNPADALKDSDGDGFSNLIEYWYGTDPQNAASRPQLAVGLVAGKPRLQWAGVLAKRYQPEYSVALASGTWTALGDPQVGAGALLQADDPVAPLPGRRFYRVRILPSFDRDGDGLDDWLETAVYATNPDISSSSGTGIPDGWAVRYGLNPATLSPTADPDGDGANNLAEYFRGTDPLVGDPPSGDAVAALSVFTPLGY